MTHLVDEFTHDGVKVEIRADDLAGNPYDVYDQASSLLVGRELARNYDLSPETIDLDPFVSIAHAHRWLTLFGGYLHAIPFKFQDYGSSGVRAWLTDPEDDHADGFVVVSQEDIDKTGATDYDEAARQDFALFVQYVEQDVYGYVAAPGTALEDSCWSFYGRESVDEAAKEAAEDIARQRADQWSENAPEYARAV